MNHHKSYEFLLKDISILKGVGKKTKILLRRKQIKTIYDVLWNLPYSYVDRSFLSSLDNLEIGKICTLKVRVDKYNIHRIRNLPITVKCVDQKGQINVVFFNSREGYIKKILPINEWVIISGKINFYRKKYQITNPHYVVPLEKENFVKKVIPQKTLDYRKNLKKLKPAYVIHGDDWKTGIQKKTRSQVIQTLKKWNGKLIEPKYTQNISSTIIKNRFLKIRAVLKKNN